MKDAIGTVIMEELYGVNYMEWGWGPHDMHYNRLRAMNGYKMPDDPRVILMLIIIIFKAMHISTFNRKHKYREHYM